MLWDLPSFSGEKLPCPLHPATGERRQTHVFSSVWQGVGDFALCRPPPSPGVTELLTEGTGSWVSTLVPPKASWAGR